MYFEYSHEFDAARDTLELALASPEFAAAFARRLPNVSLLATKEHAVDEVSLVRVLSFQADVKLPEFTRGVVTLEMCAWDEHMTYSFAKHAAEWTVTPHVKPEFRKFFRAQGTYAISSLEGGRSKRVVKGEVSLSVPMPVIGGLGERLIVSEVSKMFDVEAETLRSLSTFA